MVMALGPAYFGLERTGEVMLSLVEGVEQLEVWFGEYLPQLFIAGLTPIIVFFLLAPFDMVLAGVLTVFALVTLVAPAAFHRWDMHNSMRRSKLTTPSARSFSIPFRDLRRSRPSVRVRREAPRLRRKPMRCSARRCGYWPQTR